MIRLTDENASLKEVDFKKYCALCKYGPLAEVKDPCNECLEYGMRDETRVPLYFEEK